MRDIMFRFIFILIVISIIFSLIPISCKKKEEVREEETSAQPSQREKIEAHANLPMPELSDKAKNLPVGSKLAVIVTEKGNIEIKLLDDGAPKTVDNFISLVNQGFYDGLKFHRKLPGQLIQAGAPNPDGTGGPGYYIDDEPSPYKHTKGAVAMAKLSGKEGDPVPNTAGSQFYICLKSLPSLDGKYTVFGMVVEGLDVAGTINVGDKIKQISIVEIKGDS
ncbi:MAG: peptidylprolyl isomerase [bacterium]